MCPRCKSDSIEYEKEPISMSRAIVGNEFLGFTGAMIGATTGRKVHMKCLDCGHKWKGYQ